MQQPCTTYLKALEPGDAEKGRIPCLSPTAGLESPFSGCHFRYGKFIKMVAQSSEGEPSYRARLL